MEKEDASGVSRRDILKQAASAGFAFTQTEANIIPTTNSGEVVNSTEQVNKPDTYGGVVDFIKETLNRSDLNVRYNSMDAPTLKIQSKSLRLPLGKNTIEISSTNSVWDEGGEEFEATDIDFIDVTTGFKPTIHLNSTHPYVSDISDIVHPDFELPERMEFSARSEMFWSQADAGFHTLLEPSAVQKAIESALSDGEKSTYWEEVIEPHFRFEEQFRHKRKFLENLDSIEVNEEFEQEMWNIFESIHASRALEKEAENINVPQQNESSLLPQLIQGANIISTATDILNQPTEDIEVLPDSETFFLDEQSETLLSIEEGNEDPKDKS